MSNLTIPRIILNHINYVFHWKLQLILMEKIFQNTLKKISSVSILLSKSISYFLDLSIKLVCLNPGIGFANLNLHRPLSIILTSGTLTPLESFETELMTKFPIKLINDHVIDTKLQVIFPLQLLLISLI